MFPVLHLQSHEEVIGPHQGMDFLEAERAPNPTHRHTSAGWWQDRRFFLTRNWVISNLPNLTAMLLSGIIGNGVLTN